MLLEVAHVEDGLAPEVRRRAARHLLGVGLGAVGPEPVVLAVVRGRGRLTSDVGTIDLTTGDVWLLPAALGAWRVEATGGVLGLVDMRGPAPP